MKSVGIAVMFLYDKDKKVLMQHRAEDEEFYAGYWGCFGGHIEDGETPKEALKRELFEELEYKIQDPHLLMTSEFQDGDRMVTTYNFIEPYDTTQPLIQHEGQDYGWFTVDEALNLKISDLRREALLKAKDFLDTN